MNCVSCKEPLIVLELDQIEIDYCVECGGIWLDSGELEALLEDPHEVLKVLEAVASGRTGQQSNRRCPICDKRMIESGIGSEPEINIDFCPNNHGIWFDRGELEGVLKFFDQKHGRVVSLLQDMFRK